MKFLMKSFLSALFLCAAATAFGYFFWYKPKFRPATTSHKPETASAKNTVIVKLKNKAASAKTYAAANGYNTTQCFLIDMSVHSGKKRFFVYNLVKDSVELEGLVTHGGGGNSKDENVSFSNVPNSNCTSLGKYKIGNAYRGTFGLAYKLHGLESSNSNAFRRFVVLHGHSCVPDEDVSPFSICTSLGCPTVSPSFLQELKIIIDQSSKPVLLWIYR